MKIRPLLFLLFTHLYSCEDSNSLIGTWKCSYLNNQFQDNSNIFFQSLDLYSEDVFEPIVHFYEDSLRYDLGFGRNDFKFSSNFCSYDILENLLQLNCGGIKEDFEIQYILDDRFCLGIEGQKIVCFRKYPAEKRRTYKEYALNLGIEIDFFDLKLTLSSNGNGRIIRSGAIADTLNFDLSKTEDVYIKSLVDFINDETFNSYNNNNIGGDHANYKFILKVENKVYKGEFEGLSGISFELMALIKNMENLIRQKYNSSIN